ncbi:oppD [Eggerthella sp. CAG:298]|nr:oppD [Eggerthella sp. CAG:298]
MVFATHRLHWLDTLDYLLVLEEGKLVEQGTTTQLFESSAHFATLVRALRGGEAA